MFILAVIQSVSLPSKVYYMGEVSPGWGEANSYTSHTCSLMVAIGVHYTPHNY